MEQEFQIGAITTTHGIHGEVKVFPTTDDPGKFSRLKEVLLRNGKTEQTMEITSAKFFKNMVILKFKGIDDINEVEKYRGATLWVKRDRAVALQKNEYYKTDLMNMAVVTEDGNAFGELTDILETGANDVYVVTTQDGKEVLLPAIRECIRNVDVENRVMTVHIMDGLL